MEWEPSCLYKILHIQKKYARKDQLPESGPSLSGKNVILARKPPQPIEGGLPDPNLLAQVATCKFMDHLSLYRFERISERSGWKIPRSTTCDWLAQAARLLAPLCQQMKAELVRSRVIHLDDTPVLLFEMRNYGSWTIESMLAWDYCNSMVREFRFETLMGQYDETFRSMFESFEFSPRELSVALKIASAHNLAKMSDDQIRASDHVSARETTKWKQYFQSEHRDAFKRQFGDAVVRLGYEPTNDW